MSLAVFPSWILNQNRQVPKGVGTEMRALVACWDLLHRDAGAWSAVEVYRGLLGGHIGGSGVPKVLSAMQKPHARPTHPQVFPKRVKNEPERTPKHVQEDLYRENADLS